MRRKLLPAAVAAAALAVLLPGLPAQAAASQLTVDLATGTGALRYGATGFLYGLGDEGIPNETMLAALKPQVTAQKAPDGLQHPNGDALAGLLDQQLAQRRSDMVWLEDVVLQMNVMARCANGFEDGIEGCCAPRKHLDIGRVRHGQSARCRPQRRELSQGGGRLFTGFPQVLDFSRPERSGAAAQSL